MKESQLIFLISQPRSGSTLTQKLLGAHNSIYTRSEPWIMLYSAYALKKMGIRTEYNFALWKKASDDFINGLPNGKSTYIEEIRKMHLNLYNHYLQKSGCSYFLDKTPRYYLIIDELLQIFPEAKYILLVRNPLAVLGSIINSWTKADWERLVEYKHDLFDAVDEYVRVMADSNKEILIVHYEDLLDNPKNFLEKIFDFVELPYEDVVNKFSGDNRKWKYGDHSKEQKQKGIIKNNDIKWQKRLDNLQYWRLMHDYLHHIGKNKFEKIGYNFEDQEAILLSKKPPHSIEKIKKNTKSLDSLIKNDSIFEDVNGGLCQKISRIVYRVLSLLKFKG